MSVVKSLTLACVLAVGASTGVVAQADYYYPRQYYSGYTYNPTYKYYYRTYYYKPKPTYAGYRYHYVYYSPKYRSNVYYNPYKKYWWGRCPTEYGYDTEYKGTPVYYTLPEDKRKAVLSDIKDDDFGKAGPMPKIPEADPTDKELMDPAPGDPPPLKDDSLPKIG
jgi:hypothetical protein